MESFGHKMFISSQPVPLTGTGVLYPRMQDFSIIFKPTQKNPRMKNQGNKQPDRNKTMVHQI